MIAEMTVEEIVARQAELDAIQKQIGQESTPSIDAAEVRLEYWRLDRRRRELELEIWRAKLADAQPEAETARQALETARQAYEAARDAWQQAQGDERRATIAERKSVEKTRLIERLLADAGDQIEAAEARLVAIQRQQQLNADRQAAARAWREELRWRRIPRKERQQMVREAAGRLPVGASALGDSGEP